MKKLVLMLGCICVPMSVWAVQGKAVINGTSPDSKVTGEVTLIEENGGVKVEANIANVPAGKHGIHFHENPSCEDTGKAAGGHFNPDKVEHGFMPKDGHMHSHAGDMGNIEAGPEGTGSLSVFLPGVTLQEGEYAVVGRSIILHEKEDDFSQPTGNAGGRIGCGIIQLEETK